MLPVLRCHGWDFISREAHDNSGDSPIGLGEIPYCFLLQLGRRGLPHHGSMLTGVSGVTGEEEDGKAVHLLELVRREGAVVEEAAQIRVPVLVEANAVILHLRVNLDVDAREWLTRVGSHDPCLSEALDDLYLKRARESGPGSPNPRAGRLDEQVAREKPRGDRNGVDGTARFELDHLDGTGLHEGEPTRLISKKGTP